MATLIAQSEEHRDEQKKTVVKRRTAVISEAAKISDEWVEKFLGGLPLDQLDTGEALEALPEQVAAKLLTGETKSEPVAIISHIKAKAGMEETAQRELVALMLKTRTEPGCLGYDLYRSKVDLYRKMPTAAYFILQEKWRDRNAINEHLAKPYFKEFMSKKDTLFEGPIEVTSMISEPSEVTVDITNRVKVVLRLKAQPGQETAIRQGVLAMVDMMRSQLGCLRYDVYQGFEGIYDTSVFIVDQIWADMATFNKAGQYLEANMPFYVEELADPRQPLTVGEVSEFDTKGTVSVRENAVLGDEALQTGLRKLNPDFGDLCIRASGEAWGKPLLDQKTKVLIAIAVDVVEQITGKPFENHLHMARQQGITREELEELFLFMTIYAGFNKAGVFFAEINRVFGPRKS